MKRVSTFIIANKMAEERCLSGEDLETYFDLLDGYGLMVFLFLKKRELRSEVAKIADKMITLARQHVKYDPKKDLYCPSIASHYGTLECYEEPSITPDRGCDKVKLMTDFLKLAQSGKFKNRTAIYKELCKKYQLSHTTIVEYCKELTF